MRMRKKKWARPYIAERTDAVIEQPAEYKGRWKALLHTDTLHLEIGAGKGSYWVSMGQIYPDEGWIALEKSADAAALGLKKLEPVLPTMRFLIGDANDLSEWFADGEIDVLHLNFSDPWPKKRHEKRRLTSAKYRQMYARLLNDQGRVILKTDNQPFFLYSLESMNLDFDLMERWDDFREQPHPEDAITEYEQYFMDLGQPIYRAIWRKKNDRQDHAQD